MMFTVIKWTQDVEFLVDDLGSHTHWLIKDKYLMEELLVILCVSLVTHRNEEKHHAREGEATCVAQVTWIAMITRCYKTIDQHRQ